MAEVTNELIYEVLKLLQRDISQLGGNASEIKAELNAMRGHLISLQQDTHNIYGILARHETRLERIERRLELSDAPVP